MISILNTLSEASAAWTNLLKTENNESVNLLTIVGIWRTEREETDDSLPEKCFCGGKRELKVQEIQNLTLHFQNLPNDFNQKPYKSGDRRTKTVFSCPLLLELLQNWLSGLLELHLNSTLCWTKQMKWTKSFIVQVMRDKVRPEGHNYLAKMTRFIWLDRIYGCIYLRVVKLNRTSSLV